MSSVQNQLRDRFVAVLARIEAAAQNCGRTPEAVKLIAVSKTHPAEIVRAAIDVGMTGFGENRVQEAESKISELGQTSANWHLIGHLQSNKARKAAELFDVIHSIDSIGLVHKLDQACSDLNRTELPVLIQVDLAHEATKSGARETELENLVDVVTSSKHLKLIGFMTLPPFFDDPQLARPFFAKLREVRDLHQNRGAFGAQPGELSMGMTNDFEVAIQEGATMVRIGTAIFGERRAR